MTNFKMCQRCNQKVISNLNNPTADYYRHLSVKYCDECREIVRREKNAQSVKRYRKRKRQEQAVKSENVSLLQQSNELLMQENEALKDNYIQLVDKLEQLHKLLNADAERIWHKKRQPPKVS